jgi:hypothetical protein
MFQHSVAECSSQKQMEAIMKAIDPKRKCDKWRGGDMTLNHGTPNWNYFGKKDRAKKTKCTWANAEKTRDMFQCDGTAGGRLCWCSEKPLASPPPPSSPAPKEAVTFETCKSWGDPHITSWSGHKCDLMGLGVFPYVEKEGLEVQAWHCPLKRHLDKKEGVISLAVGVAFKVGGTTVNIIGNDLYMNGEKFEGIGKLHDITVEREDKTDRKGHPTQRIIVTYGDSFQLKSTRVTDAKSPTGYIMDWVIKSDDSVPDTDSSTTVCAIDGSTGDNVVPYVKADERLFNNEAISKLKKACGSPNVDGSSSCGPSPPPCEVCENAGIVCTDAETVCKTGAPCAPDVPCLFGAPKPMMVLQQIMLGR